MRSRKALYNIFSSLLLQVIVILYGFIVPRIIISHFGSSVNGLVSSITQFLAYITLLESGFGPVVKSVLYKPIANKDHKEIINILRTSEKFFRKIALILVFYIIILCFFYPILVNKEFSNLYTISLIIIIGISTFAEYFFGMTYRLYLQADQKTYVISFIQIITYILAIVLILIFANIGANIHVIKLVGGIIFLLRPIVQNLYVRKKYKINLSDSNEKYELKQKWDGLAQHIAAVIHDNTDITILTFFTTLTEVSIYAVYSLVVKGIKSIIQAFTSGIDSTFGDMIAKKEKDNLNKKFSIYEILYNIISTIAFSSAIVLIVPFINVYTKGITDANYVNYLFGWLLVISEYIWAIRLPYNIVIKSAGHFKQTRIGAWVECLSNIIISIVLVGKFGIIGVTIGTIVAMTIRTIEFIIHANKHILERNIWESFKKILLVFVETILIVSISNYIPLFENINYINWILNAIIIGTIATIITILFNTIFYKKELKEVIKIFKRIIKYNEKKES